jgi:glycerol-3-phosphate dehydrogenase subunit B
MAGKTISAEVVVIGAGLAGTAACLAARKGGRQVCLVAPNHGASELSSGAMDICGDPCFIKGRPDMTSRDIARNIQELLARNPAHPYNLLSQSGEAPAEIISLFEQALEALFPEGEKDFLTGSTRQSQAFLTNLGTFKFSAFAPSLAACLDEQIIERPVVVSFLELADFHPEFWLKAARVNAQMLGKSIDDSGIAMVDLSLGAEMSSPEMAALLENQGHADIFIEKIAANRDRLADASVAVLPPVLPFQGRARILKELKQETGCEFRELISLPPSAPGMRLARHMSKRIEEQIDARGESLKRIFGKVTGFSSEDERLISIQVELKGSCQDKLQVEGSVFILTTGSFVGGGIKKDPEFRETVFNLPVFSDNEKVKKIFTQKLTQESIPGPHKLFSVGVRADNDLRPLDEKGKPVFKNLRAAGAILAGGNYLTHGTGAGTALTTGFKAGSM